MAYTSADQVDAKKWEIAYYYVNKWGGNKSQAYMEYYRQHELEIPKACNTSAYRFFKDEEVQALIEQFRKENREKYIDMRDNNIALLRDISTDEKTKQSDRIAAIKELNSMCGYNAQNINLNGKVDSEIIVEIEGL